MRKIVLIETKSPGVNVYSNMPFPRIGTILIGTILKNEGYDVKIYVEDVEPINLDDAFKADLVGISVLTPTAPRSYALADLIRKAGVPVVLGGTHVTFLTDEALDHSDFVVRYEGEETIVELVNCLNSDGDFSKIPGLSFNADGEKIHNPPRRLIEDLDVLPYLDFSLIEGDFSNSIIPMDTARGCPFGCTFCSVTNFNGKKYRVKSVERVLDELEFCMKEHHSKFLFFTDDIFNLNAERTKSILRGMIERKLTPKWGAQVRHEASRDDELIELMAKANCNRVFVGYESINQRTLDLYSKKQSIENIINSISAFHRHKIKVHGMFVLGSDEDTVKTVKETRKFAQKWKIDSVQFLILTPIPGSQDFEKIARQECRLISKNWSLYDGHHVVHRPLKISPYDLQLSVLESMKKFYSKISILKRFIRGDMYEAFVRWSARKLIKQWFKDLFNKSYVTNLKLYIPGMDRFQIEIPPSPIKGAITIAYPHSSTGIKNVLEDFLKRLDIKVISSNRFSKRSVDEILRSWQESVERSRTKFVKSVYEYLSAFKGKVDYIILPITEKLEKNQRRIFRELEDISKILSTSGERLPRIIPYSLRGSRHELTPAIMQIGMLFTADQLKIQSAIKHVLFPS
ncbi:MAG: B12-binding domain-containing radical SAM protein [Fidelibacterota bacterium]